MTWFKVDDGFYDHPKVHGLRAGKHCQDALALWLVAGSWCARYLTDGVIPHAQVHRFRPGKSAAQELVRVGLWVEVEGGYAFHEWDEHQDTRAEVKTRRKAANERSRRHRNASPSRVSNASQGIRARYLSDPSQKPKAAPPSLPQETAIAAVLDVALTADGQLPDDMTWLSAGEEKAARSRREIDAFDEATGNRDPLAPPWQARGE